MRYSTISVATLVVLCAVCAQAAPTVHPRSNIVEQILHNKTFSNQTYTAAIDNSIQARTGDLTEPHQLSQVPYNSQPGYFIHNGQNMTVKSDKNGYFNMTTMASAWALNHSDIQNHTITGYSQLWLSITDEIQVAISDRFQLLKEDDPTGNETTLCNLAGNMVLGLAPDHVIYKVLTMRFNPDQVVKPCREYIDQGHSAAGCVSAHNDDPSKAGPQAFADFYKDWSNSTGGEPFPFTGMGYTYDWGRSLVTDDTNKSNYGGSEYVVVPGTKLDIVEKTDVLDFCKRGSL
eukprot:Nk52_evm13s564 gene=Nk52_evmTU13s564